MTIDEAMALVKIEKECISRACECNRKCNECDLVQDTNKMLELYTQLAKWLEELKDYRDKNKMVVRIDCVNQEEFKDMAVKLAKEKYNKAIDDFVEKAKYRIEYNYSVLDEMDIYEIAEQLKAGEENERM